jgi:hypothetical protein
VAHGEQMRYTVYYYIRHKHYGRSQKTHYYQKTDYINRRYCYLVFNRAY